MKPDDCVFCDYAGPSEILYEDSRLYVIEPINPVTEGHVLVTPKVHATQDHPVNLGLAFEGAVTWAKGLQVGREEDSNIILNLGPDATQTIEHLHVHVIPRRPGDGLALPWSRGMSMGRSRLGRL